MQKDLVGKYIHLIFVVSNNINKQIMKSFNRIELGMLVNVKEGVARIVGVSENFRGEVELMVQMLNNKVEYTRMQSEVTYVD
tara:strand:- start:535 stop:780 length:246 start_codon:yes stop_codon:yes gene_type:complete